VSPDVAAIVRVFFWAGAVALSCWLVVMGLEAVPSFREAARPRPGEPLDGPVAEGPEPSGGHY
jgi:hypothetical protein